MTKFVKQSVLAVGGEVVIFVGSLLFGMITARTLGPSGKGILGVLSGAYGILVTVLSLRFERAVMYYSATKPDEVSRTVSGGLLVGGLMLFAFFPAYWFIPESIRYYVFGGVPVEYVMVALLFLPNTYLMLILSSLFAGQRRFEKRLAFLAVVHLVRVSVAFFGLVLCGFSLREFIILFSITECVLYGTLLVLVFRMNRWAFGIDWSHLKGMVQYAAAGSLSIPSELVLSNLFLLVLSVVRGSYEAGLFVVAIMMTNTLGQFANALKDVILPYAASDGNVDESQVLRVLISIELLMSIGLVLAGRYVLVLLYGTQFEGSFLPAVLLVPGVLGATVCSVLSASLQGRGRPGLASLAPGVGSLCAIALVLWLIPLHGILGAAIANAAANLFSAFTAVFLYVRLTKSPVRRMFVLEGADIRATVAVVKDRWHVMRTGHGAE
ncbi:MAG: polysaccharide biosynthesis C-terminal domain-containing protein [Bacteroidetes bacterium]|nr:polysaccharide biosynthesis C-terminal domain-containing protein [Bacteroidota bacterium]